MPSVLKRLVLSISSIASSIMFTGSVPLNLIWQFEPAPHLRDGLIFGVVFCS